MTTKEKQGIRDIYTVLDYYTKSALSHSGYILVCFFGIFSILTVLTGFNKISELSTFFLTYAILVSAYALIVSFGLYEIRRWKFYSSRAKDIADFIKNRLRSNNIFRKRFCEVLKVGGDAKKKKEWYEKELLMSEWEAVGKKDEEQKEPIFKIFDHAERYFFAFCTVILVGVFVGVYNGEIVNVPRFLLFIIIIVIYLAISWKGYVLLKDIHGMRKRPN